MTTHGWSMRQQSRLKLEDPSLAEKLHRATLRTTDKDAKTRASMPGFQSMRERAREARLRALDRHDEVRQRFIDNLQARGIHVTVAETTHDAVQLITELVSEAGGKVIKSKSMTSEEVGLNAALESAGAQVTETDLGELIVQMAQQPPSHVTAPAIHLSTEDIARIFRDHLGMTTPAWVDSDEPVAESVRQELARDLSLAARRYLRSRFLQADVGISGANLLVAETGTLVLVENEANIQLTTGLPRRHIVLAGLDKLIENEADLAPILSVLSVAATGQRQPCYVSFFADRHEDMHVVLLDNGRTRLRNDAQLRDLLTCIRCGACLNACPVYRNIGGHAYGGAYAGPIGALLLPNLSGTDRFAELPFASSLCGACSEACPARIPLHERLLQMRERLAGQQSAGELGLALRLGRAVMRKPERMAAASKLYRFGRVLAPLSAVGRAWTASRELPVAPGQTFRAWWRRERSQGRGAQSDGSPPRPPGASKEAGGVPPAPPAATASTPDAVGLDLFLRRIEELGPGGETEAHRFANAGSAMAHIKQEIARHDPSAVLIEGEVAEKREYELGISTAAFIIAETGGIVLDRKNRSENRVSTLVQTHLVVVDPGKMVSSVEAALARRAEQRARGALGDYQVFVTGPSRTADVEKVLVIPAHGPRRLSVVLCEETVDLGSLRD